MHEKKIRFFHRIYIFYDWNDIEKAKLIYTNHKNYDEFENDLDSHNIIFCYDMPSTEGLNDQKM